jgi:hypothetical protein
MYKLRFQIWWLALSLSPLLTPFRAPINITRTGAGALCTGADDPRLGAERSATWRRGRVPCLTCRTVRALGPDGLRVRRGGGVHRWRLDLATRRDPVGEERS